MLEARPIVFGGGTVRFFQMGRNDEAGVRSLEQTEEDERANEHGKRTNYAVFHSTFNTSEQASAPGTNGDPCTRWRQIL